MSAHSGLLDGAEAGRIVVRAAVMRAIFCPDCGHILDIRDAVLVTGTRGAAVACGRCFDRQINTAAEKSGFTRAQVLELFGPDGIDDGRTLDWS